MAIDKTRCPVKYEIFTSESPYRPMIFKCGHTICEGCVDHIFNEDGQLKCPMCNQIFYSKDDAIVNVALCGEDLGQCNQHKRVPEKFCVRHSLLLCELCQHASSCCCAKDWHEEQFDIHNDLVAKVEALASSSDAALPQTLANEFKSRNRLKNAALHRLLMRLKDQVCALKCMRCGGMPTKIDISQFSVLCEKCGQEHHDKTAGVQGSPPQYIDYSEQNEPATVSKLVTVGKSLLAKCHFYTLTRRHYDGLQTPSEYVKDALDLVREINSLIGQRDPEVVPATFLCPKCLTDQPSSTFRKLNCRDVNHAICWNCYSAENITVQCPLDGKQFQKVADNQWNIGVFPQAGLPAVAPASVARAQQEPCCPGMIPLPDMRQSIVPPAPPPSIPRRSADPHLLENQGIQVPPYLYNYYFHSVKKFEYLFPMPVLPDHLRDLEKLCRGWPINFGEIKEHAEAMSFMVFSSLEIVGLSIGNPVTPGDVLILDSVKLYGSYTAIRDPVDTATINPNQIIGGESYVTDIYFDHPLRILEFREYTLKLKYRPSRAGKYTTLMYCGNHMSRPKNPVGTDQMSWEFVETHAVESFETCSLQLHLTGPIIRIIYRNG